MLSKIGCLLFILLLIGCRVKEPETQKLECRDNNCEGDEEKGVIAPPPSYGNKVV